MDEFKESPFIFINRRRGRDRRTDTDPCKHLPMDLYHRKRRKSTERRDTSKTLSDDYYAYMQKVMSEMRSESESR